MKGCGMASKVYLVMNDLGCESVYGKRIKAEERRDYLLKKYALNHWIEIKEIAVD
jgi:hypothetical protein